MVGVHLPHSVVIVLMNVMSGYWVELRNWEFPSRFMLDTTATCTGFFLVLYDSIGSVIKALAI